MNRVQNDAIMDSPQLIVVQMPMEHIMCAQCLISNLDELKLSIF